MSDKLLARVQPLLAALAALAIALPGLGSAGLLDPWEMDRVAVARTMSGPAIVLSTLDEAQSTTLAGDLGKGFSLRPVQGGLSKAAGELAGRIAHALVVDGKEALTDDARIAMLDARVAELDRIIEGSPGMAVVIAADEPAAAVQERMARSRARAFHRAMQGGFWRAALPGAKDADSLAPLFWSPLEVRPLAEVAAAVRAAAPSPWSIPQHRHDRAAAPAPLLDAWLVGASLSLFGPSEFAARLPGALLFALSAGLLFWALCRQSGALAGWLAVLVLCSLPMALGTARIVTFEASAAFGLLLTAAGATLLADDRRLLGLGLVVDGLLVLLFGRGLGGLTMGAGLLLVFAIARGRNLSAWLGAGLGVLGLGVAAAVVLGDDVSPLLRAMRFTRVPFGGGLGADDRDLSVVVGQVGFGLHPWGGLFLLGAGRLLFPPSEDEANADANGGRTVWLLAFGAGLLATALLLPKFDHVVAPVAPLAAAVTALLLVEVFEGRVRGSLLALFVIVAALLLHRETGKDAGTLARFLAWDPPFGGEKAAFQWPEELKMPRIARALGLLGVAGCALGMARPVQFVRGLADALQGRVAAFWVAGGLLTAWALDALISMGIRLDVLLRAEANRTGYGYDRMWVTIQAIRPEVIAFAIVFVLLLIATGLAGARADHPLRRWIGKLAPLAKRPVALGLLAVGALGTLGGGVWIHTSVAQRGVGAALADGAMRPIFFLPLLAALAIAGWNVLGRRRDPAAAANGAVPSLPAAGVAAVLGLAGLGAGASAAAGTWTYGFYATVWAVGLGLIAFAAGGVAPRASFARAALGVGAVTAAALFMLLADRLMGLTPDAAKAIAKMLVAAPDSGGLLLLAGLALANHLATERAPLERVRGLAFSLAGRIERPAMGVASAGIGAFVLGAGYAFGLLPEMSVHFSQKHLIAAIAEAGGMPSEGEGEDVAPRAFKHPGNAGSKVLGSNFYTVSLPTVASRDEALALLGKGTPEVSLTEWGEQGRSAKVKAPEGARFVVLPKSEFSGFNHAFRKENEGRSVQVLDASSSRLVLAASALPEGKTSQNWLDDAVLDKARFDALAGVHKIHGDFDGKLILIGWRLGEASVRRSQKYHLELYFQVKEPVGVSYKLFMHPHPLHRDLWPYAVVPDTDAEAKRCTGCFQTNHWSKGDIVRVDIDQEVPLGTNAGPQDIILGWYDPLSDKRLPLISAHGPGVVRHNDNRITVGRLLVR